MKPICIIGPTAIGKTVYAINLAQKINAEIISADSMQVYREMDIGTAKPDKVELQAVKHHLIDICDPDEPYTVVDFVQNVSRLVPEINSRGKQVLIVGGTGLYLNALFSGLSFTGATSDEAFREERYAEHGEILHQQLQQVDPVAAAKIHPHNKKRVIRALEVFQLTGIPMSEQIFKVSKADNYEIIGLDCERSLLYERINQRVEKMFKAGLINEVEALQKKGYNKNLPSIQALGYKETIAYLEGSIASKEELVSLIQQRTRNFAKRQLTWFRRFETVRWEKTCY